MEDTRSESSWLQFPTSWLVSVWHSVNAHVTATHTRAHRMAAHNGLNNLSRLSLSPRFRAVSCPADLTDADGPEERRAPRASRRLRNAISPLRFESAFEVVRPGFSIGTQRHNGIDSTPEKPHIQQLFIWNSNLKDISRFNADPPH